MHTVFTCWYTDKSLGSTCYHLGLTLTCSPDCMASVYSSKHLCTRPRPNKHFGIGWLPANAGEVVPQSDRNVWRIARMREERIHNGVFLKNMMRIMGNVSHMFMASFDVVTSTCSHIPHLCCVQLNHHLYIALKLVTKRNKRGIQKSLVIWPCGGQTTGVKLVWDSCNHIGASLRSYLLIYFLDI